MAQRLWSRGVGLTAAALFYCTPFVQDLSQTARIDLATAFFATLAFGALVLWMEDDQRKELLWLSALGAGEALATKWPAAVVVLLPATVAVAVCRKYRLLAGYGLVVFAMVAPWLVKNWLLTEQPGISALVSVVPEPVLEWRAGAGTFGKTSRRRLDLRPSRRCLLCCGIIHSSKPARCHYCC